MALPALKDEGPNFCIATLATKATTVLKVEVLFVTSGSMTPGGLVTVAELVILPVAPGATLPVTVITKLDPDGSVGKVPETLLPSTEIETGHRAPPVADPQLAATALI